MRKKAIAVYEKISPQTKEVLSNLADLYLKEKNYQKAISNYQKLAKLEPKKAGSFANLGYAYAASGNLDLAIKNYTIALKFDRDDADIYDNLGEAYEKKGLYKQALETYKKAYALNPESAKAAKRIPRLNIKFLQEKKQQKTGSEEE
jgi:superkiller protein 3